MPKKVRGFTLTELLIVVAMITVLAAAIILIINPAKLLAKSRDSQRFSDITGIVNAMNLYLADNKPLVVKGPFLSTDGTNNGTGWIPINFTLVSSGAPLGVLPIDPVNNATYHYSFGADPATKTYEVDCVFEYADNIIKQSADGGNNKNVYEIGTDLTILP